MLWILVALILLVAVRNAPVEATSLWVSLSYEGDASEGFVRDAAQEILSASLDGVGPVRVISRDRADDGAPRLDADSARALAASLGASHLLVGTVRAWGDSVALDVTLRETAGSRARTISRAGLREELPAHLDELAGLFAARMYGTKGADPRRADDVLSASLPALEAYFRAERSFAAGRYAQAGALYDRALRDDPDFALAHYRKALAAGHLDRPDLVRSASAAALAGAGGLGARDALLVEAQATWVAGDPDGAEALLRALVRDYRDDGAGWLQLAELLSHSASHRGRPLTGAAQANARALALDPGNIELLEDAARIALAGDDEARLESLLQQAREWAPEAPVTRALEIVAAGSPDEAPTSSWDGLSDEAVRTAVRLLASAKGDVDAALRVVGALTGPRRAPGVRALGEVWQAYLLLARGQRRAAAEAFGRAGRLDPDLALEHEALAHTLPFLGYDTRSTQALAVRMDRWRPGGARANEEPEPHYGLHLRSRAVFAPYLSGRLSLALGDTAAAAMSTVETRTLPWETEGPPLQAALGGGLAAELAAAEGRFAAALDILEPAYAGMAYQRHQPSVLASLARERWQMAGLLEALDRPEEAARWFEPYWGLVPEAVFLAPSYFRRAGLREATGDTVGAVSDYQRFLGLWRDADPELQGQVMEARERVTALGG